MSIPSSGIRWPLLGTLAVGLLVSTEMTARGAGHGGGHGGGAPRISAPRQAYTAPRMPHATAPAYNNISRNRSASTHTQAQAGTRQGRANKSVANTNKASSRAAGTTAQTHSRNATGSSTVGGNSRSGGVSPATKASANALGSLSSSSSPYRYTYGTGSGATGYRAYGYGRGYRNRYYGSGYGYGRSQSLNRGIVSRLRSVQASLARVNHDYQGHRVQAMNSISMAIRQLSNRSMVYSGAGFASGMNNGIGQGMGMGQGMRGRRSGLGGRGVGGQPMTQAQSDARMSQALRNLQGIGMQLSSQGYSTMGHGRALGHIQNAAHHLNVALSIR